MKFPKIMYGLALLCGLLAATQTASAADIIGINPSVFIRELYLFALAISGLLALGMIIMGGVQYITSAGNSGRQGAAKTRILNALLGLLLLIGSYIILNTLNPAIVSLRIPRLCNEEPKNPGDPCPPLTPPP